MKKAEYICNGCGCDIYSGEMILKVCGDVYCENCYGNKTLTEFLREYLSAECYYCESNDLYGDD